MTSIYPDELAPVIRLDNELKPQLTVVITISEALRLQPLRIYCKLGIINTCVRVTVAQPQQKHLRLVKSSSFPLPILILPPSTRFSTLLLSILRPALFKTTPISSLQILTADHIFTLYPSYLGFLFPANFLHSQRTSVYDWTNQLLINTKKGTPWIKLPSLYGIFQYFIPFSRY